MTRFCTCPGGVASPLEYSRKRNKLAEASCKTCGGRSVVDGIGPLSRSMLGSVGLEVTSSVNPEFNWKTVTKGKRSRKAVARGMNRGLELGNKSPKRVGDFSGSDSDKFGETSNGGKVECVPLKKRRHLFRSPSSRPPGYGGESMSPQVLTPSSHSEDLEHLSDHNGSSGSYTNGLPSRTGNGVHITSGVFYNSEYFSGIAVLAAAACINNIDDDAFNDKVDAMEVSSAPQRSPDTSTSTLPQREVIHSSKSGELMHESGLENKECLLVEGSADASHGLNVSEELVDEKSVSSKVDRLHWDLNTSMDAWEQPNDDADNGKEDDCLDVSNGVTEMPKLEKEGCTTEKSCRNEGNDDESCLHRDQLENVVECSTSKLEVSDSEELCSHDRLDMKEACHSTLNGTSTEPVNFTSADTNSPEHAISRNELMDNSPKAESCHSSEVSEQDLDQKSDCVAVTSDEEGCKNAIESSLSNPSDHNVTGRDNSLLEKSGCEDDSHTEIAKDSQMITEFPVDGNSLGQEMCLDSCKTLDAEHCESISGNDSHAFQKQATVTALDISIGGEADGSSGAKGQHMKLLAASSLGMHAGERSVSKEILPQPEDPQIPNEESEETPMLEESGFVNDDRQNLDVPQNDRTDAMEQKAELEVGYDSPYEDGELRGSVLYSWEENEFEDGEQECVYYESDGRGGEDSDAGDFAEPENLEVDSGSTDKRGLSGIPIQGTDSTKSGSRRSFLKRELENENSEKSEASGERESNQGSGTTEEMPEDVTVERNYGRSHTADRMDVTEEKGQSMGEVRSKTSRGKLPSRADGLSSLESMGRDVACNRSNATGAAYLQDERDGAPERSVAGYRSPVQNRERNEGDSEYFYWDPRDRHPSGCHGPDGHHGSSRHRTGIANSTDKFSGVDSHEQRHSSKYSSRTERGSSPDRFGSRYRSIGQERDRNGGTSQMPYWVPRMRYPSSHSEDSGQTRPRNAISDSVDKFGGYNDRKQSTKYSSKTMQRPLGWRRSPNDRDDYHGGPRRMGFGSSGNRGGSRKFSECVGRGFREDYHHPGNDDSSSVRTPHYASWRERNFFPHSMTGAHASAPRRSSRSRSRTRSPRTWQPQRERNVGTRRHSRSPDFRSESRMERTRVPFQKTNLGADYGDNFMSPPKGRFSPQRNFRRGDDKTLVDSPLRHRRSPISVFRQGQRLDSVGLPGRLKSDDPFRTTMRPGRFPLMPGVGRGWKLEDSNFGAEYRDGFMSQPNGRFSPKRSFRRADDRKIVDGSHLRHRRSPISVFRQGQRLDSAALPGRIKSDDSFRSTMRPGRFPLMAGGGREIKLEDNNFGADCGDSFLSSPRGQLSPQGNFRADDQVM